MFVTMFTVLLFVLVNRCLFNRHIAKQKTCSFILGVLGAGIDICLNYALQLSETFYSQYATHVDAIYSDSLVETFRLACNILMQLYNYMNYKRAVKYISKKELYRTKYLMSGDLERYMAAVVCQHLRKKLTGRLKSHSVLNLVFFATLEGFISFLLRCCRSTREVLPSLQIIHYPFHRLCKCSDFCQLS